jgi:uncharacterized protein YacL (UPF0231 family)
MKKLFIVTVIATVILAACGGGGVSSSTYNPGDTLTRSLAMQMIAHYLDSNVNHTLDSIIKQIYLNVDDIKEVLKNKKITRIKLLTAAYLDTDPIVLRRNHKTVIIQLKEEKGGNTKYYYYDVEVVTKGIMAKVICPPPPDCYASIED